jgi:hypothetical protein
MVTMLSCSGASEGAWRYKLVLGQPKLGRYLQLLCGPRSNTDDFLLF